MNPDQTDPVPGHIVQSVTCLTTDPGVTSSIPTRSHTFTELDHEIISTAESIFRFRLIFAGALMVKNEMLVYLK